jgi:hypothetical protein
MIFYWSIHVKLACPYCMENKRAFTLINNGKTSFFYCYWRFLPIDNKYKKNFFIDRVENDVASPVPSTENFYNVVL